MGVQDYKDIECTILQTVYEFGKPLGAGLLSEILQEQKNITLSETTTGRYLRRLEIQGLLKSESYNGRVRGRVLTERGLKKLKEQFAGRKQAKAVEDILSLLRNGGNKQLRNVLEARKIIEPAAAALAALNATKKNLDVMEKNLETMAILKAQGKQMSSTDAPFHIEIARASGNHVLATVMNMIRTDYDYSPEIECIVNRASNDNPADHQNIYHAIKNGDAEEARRLMTEHIDNIIKQLELYEKERDGGELI